MISYLNGQQATDLPIGDRGLAYGDGVFETIALGDKAQPQLWQAHWQRLRLGLVKLGFTGDLAELYTQLSHDIKGALSDWARTKQPRGVLKITVTRGVGGRGYLPPEQPQLNRLVQISAWQDQNNYKKWD